MTESNNTENCPKHSKSREAKVLFLESWFLFKKYFPQIIQLLCVFTIISLLSIVLNSQQPDAGPLNLLLLGKKLVYFASYVLIMIANIIVSFAIIKVIDQDLSVVDSMIDIAKRIVPIFLSLVLPIVALITLFAPLFYILLIALKFSGDFGFKILYMVMAATLLCITTHYLIRISFLSFILLLEEKYYLKAISRSFSYSRYNICAILFKCAIVLILAFVFDYIISIMISPLVSNLSFVKGDKFAQESMKGISQFLSAVFVTIYSYLLYKFYKQDLPENFSLTTQQKIKFIKGGSLGLVLVVFVFFILIFK